jgi:glycosyltransferase involved in cell wall biosynthesis
MLSICIPTYRYDVRPLAHELLRQAAELEKTVEILVYDDASPDDGDWGREELRRLPGIHYVELEHNLGRAAIRNKLAREAQNSYLLLLDADGQPPNHFLYAYLFGLTDAIAAKVVSGEELVIVGGRKYSDQPPAQQELHLHWCYGTKRESRSVTRRQSEKWLGFQSNNFLVSRSVLLTHPFPEDVAGYGHEDTLWGQQMDHAGVPIYHIDNPVIHLGLEPNDVFLRKQREAISNLALLHQQFSHLRTRLIDLAEKFPLVKYIVKRFPEDWLVRRLTDSKRPSFYWLDLLKLKWWFVGLK